MSTTSTTTTLNDVDIDAVGRLVEKIKSNPEKANAVRTAEVVWKRGFQSDADVGDYVVSSDMPKGLGGDGSAPNPTQAVVASLGNCLAVGYAANATAKNIHLDELKINVTGSFNLKRFLGIEPGNAGFDNIRVGVSIKSDATDEQLQELHKQVVATSPVGHTLSHAVPVAIELE